MSKEPNRALLAAGTSLHPAVLRLPAVERPFRHAELPADLLHGGSHGGSGIHFIQRSALDTHPPRMEGSGE